MESLLKVLVAGFSLVTFCPVLHAQVAFAPPINYAVGTNSGGRAITPDINGDGKVDLIFASTPIQVFTNNGSGVFGAKATYAFDFAPWSITAADIDRDGAVDLITANHETNTLSILTNDGTGSFTLKSSPTVGSHPRSVAVADVNEDGYVDLISANVGEDGSLSVLTNDGSGDFTLGSSLSADGIVDSVVAADLNGDSRVDLVNVATSGLSIFTNNGLGGFMLDCVILVGGLSASAVAADVNGDGKTDLIAANSGFANLLSVLTNNGNGGFALSSTFEMATPLEVIATDINRDGMMDLVSANQGTGDLAVLTNNGSGGFVMAVAPFVGDLVDRVLAADINADGSPDLISGKAKWYPHSPNPIFVSSISVFVSVPVLRIERVGHNVIVSWPSSWTNWVLQQSSALTAANWSASSGISDNGTSKSITVPSPIGNLFFRLTHP